MLILPIGHDEATVRRLPWVTFSIIGLCLLTFLITSPGSVEDPDEYLDEPLQYYLGHPYLELDPELRHKLEAEGGEFLKTYLELFGAEQTPENIPQDPEVLAQEQAELDRLTEAWLEARKKTERSGLFRGGLVPARFSAVSLLTHMFLHGGWLHLIGNMLFLLLSGPFIEDKWGRPLYAGLYLLSGVLSGGMFAAWYPTLDIPLIGASGAIAGLMGAFLIRFTRTSIKFFYWYWFRVGTFDAPAWLMLPLWLADQLWTASLMDYYDPTGRSHGVAYWAHIWGFAAGLIFALAMRVWKVEERLVAPVLEAKLEESENPVLDQAAEAMEQGKPEEALKLLREAVRQNPNNGAAILAWWDAALTTGQPQEAAPAMLRLVRHKLAQGEIEAALEHWAEVLHKAPGVQAETALEIKLMESLAQLGRTEEARSLLQRLLERSGPQAPPAVQVKLARAAWKLASPMAPALITQALAGSELPEPTRRELQQLLVQEPPAAAKPAAAPAAAKPAAAPSDQGPAADSAAQMPAAPASASGTQMPAAPASASGTQMPAAPAAHKPAAAPPAGKPAAAAPARGSAAATAARKPAATPAAEKPAAAPAGELSFEFAPEPAAPRRTLQVVSAVPIALQGKQLTIQADGKGQGALALDRVRALAVAYVQKPGAPPCVVLDLLFDSIESTAPSLPLVRLESTRFDPRKLVPGAASGLEAFQRLVDQLLGASGARPLPDEASAHGRPFRTFPSVEEYERAVLL